MIVVDVSELDRLAVAFARSAATIQRPAADAVADTADAIADTARANVRVLTGETKGSIGTDRRGLSAVIGPTTEAGRHLEHGTRKMPAYPFMGPAFARHALLLPSRLADVAEANTLRRI